ncbi:MAG: zinc metallopeptidase [Gemmatimonadaceae bacterium]|nr:zinc metallopeptidase [Gemmatimonadaceae bacterium]
MRWTDKGRSSNLEDRRGGGGRRAGGIGIVGIVLALGISFFTGVNPLEILGVVGGVTGSAGGAQEAAPIEDAGEEPMVRFLSSALDDAQTTWRSILAQNGKEYPDAKLVLFRQAVTSACGNASSAMGPFYCPGDQKVYIDLEFYEQLDRNYGAPGDFAQVYVLAHEIGHHVQNVLGTERAMRQAQQANPAQRNALSVAMELQADCYAGVWAYQVARRGDLEAGDVEEGLGAASAVGDDRLQQQARGEVNPESFTHGSSAQRMQWFRAGLERGDPAACDTFGRER